MAGGDYRKYRGENQDVSVTTTVNSTGASGGQNIITGVASGAIFVQRAMFVPTTTGAVSWSLVDSSSGNPAITPLVSMTGSGYSQDYGSRGIQLTTGASLQLLASATGAAGFVNIEGYRKYMGGTSVGNFPASGASGTTP